MIAYLQRITRQRWFWMALLVSALLLELCAMVFQHGLGLLPCVLCVYERIVTLGLLTAALVALINPRQALFRWLGILIWGCSAIRGLQLALKHVDYQRHPSPFNTCSLLPDFPAGLPLDSWVPWFFAAYADCAQRQWSRLGWA